MGIGKILKKILGDQSERAVRPLWKRVTEQINPISAELQSLSNDELRARVDVIRDDIRGVAKQTSDRIAELRQEIETLDYDKREPLWKEIDTLREEKFEMYARKLDEALPEVFAIVKETARRFKENDTLEVTATDADRALAAQGKDFISIEGDKAIYKNEWMAGGNLTKWDMVHYDVQLIGGQVLHGMMIDGKKVSNNIAEMATGEGKTLVATLPVFLNALTGEGVHVVTVNDYLAKRDSEWMGPLYQFHGLTVACIDKTRPNSKERRAAYECDVTFGTNNEFGFDYLRDNMALMTEDLVQRQEHYYAIVDEVDSVLIDDARTPLIISGPVPKGDDQMFVEFKPNVEKVYNAQRRLAQNLLVEARNKITAAMSGDPEKIAKYDERPAEEKAKKALSAEQLLEDGGLALFRVYKGLPKYQPLIRYLSEEGIKQILLKVEAKYMADNNREMPKAVEPLYFVIDEKNHSIELTDKGIEVLSGTNQDPEFFILPDIAAQLSAVENEPLTDEQKQSRKDELLQNYSIVFQDVTLFNNTVMENIRLGRKDASDAEVLEAARLANVDGFVEKLPDKWDTMIGENGCELSGGERQRISIARAFLKNAPIILLDEATASLDVENETLIQESLSRLIQDKTVMIIAHRMRTVAGADKIVVLSDGTVAEQGNSDMLLKKNGIYARMVKLQTQSQNWAME